MFNKCVHVHSIFYLKCLLTFSIFYFNSLITSTKMMQPNWKLYALHPCLKSLRIIITYTVIHSFSARYCMCFMVCVVFLYTQHQTLRGSLLVLGCFLRRPLYFHSSWDLLLKAIFIPRSGHSCSGNTSLLDHWAIRSSDSVHNFPFRISSMSSAQSVLAPVAFTYRCCTPQKR